MSNHILSREELQTQAPSIFAEHPSSKVSSIYSFIPTTKILDKLNLNKGLWQLADTMADAKDEREFLQLVEAR